MLTFGSLFAGVGGFDVGFEQAGWTSRWQVEWDKHCQQVLARHWPNTTRFDDVSTVNGTELEPVDVVSFGSPCQDLSVAGRRAGLDGARSGLFHEAIRIIQEMRHATAGIRPRFAIWENVPGAFSSNKGDDFRAVIGAFADLGAVEVAWRVLDSRFFGVAQRRRRVFVVADFGGECAGSLLFEPAGVCRDSAPSGTERPFVTSSLTGGLGSGGPDFAHAAAGWLVPSVSPAVTSKWAKGTGGPAGDECQNLVVQQPFVKGRRAQTVDDDETWRPDPVAPTLNQFDTGDTRTTVAVATQTTVRRLTPRECERLQGFPDDHTRWRADGKEQSDSQRYRQIGNAVTVPVARWIAEQINAALAEEEQ